MRVSWMVVNQSQSPAFEAMMAEIARELGPCRLLTGMPHGTDTASLDVRRGPAYDRRSTARRLASWARFAVRAVRELALVRRGALVLVTTNPPVLQHLAWMASRARGFRYVVLLWDLYPDHLVKIGWFGASHPVVRAWRALNRAALGRAAAVVAIGDSMARAAIDGLGAGSAVQVKVIPNWADTDAVRPREKRDNHFALQHGQVGKVTVLYSGNLGATHGVGVIPAIAERLREDSRVGFLVIGQGFGRDALEADIARRGLTNVALVDYQPWSVVPLSLATGEIAVVAQASGSESLSVPSKAYSALAAGSAILALTSPGSDLATLVKRHEVGAVCDPQDPVAAARAIAALLDDPDRLASCRNNARAAAEQYFSIPAVRTQWITTLRAVMGTLGEGAPHDLSRTA